MEHKISGATAQETAKHGHAAKRVVPRPSVKEETLKLPVQVYSYADVARLAREAEELELFFTQAAVRGASNKSMPQLSQLLNLIINDNKLNLLHKDDRAHLITFLKSLRETAPIVHASFAADPKPDFLMKIVGWFRREAHPYVLLQVGLMPNIAAGCIFRTTNKYFDFSFKHHFQDSKKKLAAAMKDQKS